MTVPRRAGRAPGHAGRGARPWIAGKGRGPPPPLPRHGRLHRVGAVRPQDRVAAAAALACAVITERPCAAEGRPGSGSGGRTCGPHTPAQDGTRASRHQWIPHMGPDPGHPARTDGTEARALRRRARRRRRRRRCLSGSAEGSVPPKKGKELKAREESKKMSENERRRGIEL